MNRRRRIAEDDQHNKERWLISYADFITLLFAFFVVMYSVSSVNEGKYKVLSETMSGVFNVPQRSFRPIDVGDRPLVDVPRSEDNVIQPQVMEAPRNPEIDEKGRTEALRAMADKLTLEFDDLISQGVITVESNEAWLELSLRNSLLFGSGDAEPHYDAFPVVETIASVLVNRDNAIRVEGFTDDQPIRSSAFPSNWELSAARAAAVVRLLAMEGVEAERLAAIGYGQHQPIARNDTEEGRRRNRRVVLLISRDASIRGAMR